MAEDPWSLNGWMVSYEMAWLWYMDNGMVCTLVYMVWAWYDIVLYGTVVNALHIYLHTHHFHVEFTVSADWTIEK